MPPGGRSAAGATPQPPPALSCALGPLSGAGAATVQTPPFLADQTVQTPARWPQGSTADGTDIPEFNRLDRFGSSPRQPGSVPAARPKQWTDAVAVLRRLQGEYEAWRDGLPESLAGSRTAELLEGVCDVDLDTLDVKLPRGFGRD